MTGSDLVSDANVLLLSRCSGGTVEDREVRDPGNVSCGYGHDASEASGVEVVQSGELSVAECKRISAVDECAGSLYLVDLEPPFDI